MSASPAARRSATRFCRWRCSSRRSASSTRPIPASTSTRCASSPTASMRCARRARASLVITHYQRLLDYIVPDRVHVLSDGRVARSGGQELALELEADRLRRIRRQGSVGTRTMDLPVQHSGPRPSRPISTCSRRPGRRFPARRSIRVAGCGAKAFETYGRARPAASPDRGLEIYRPARPADRRQSAADADGVAVQRSRPRPRARRRARRRSRPIAWSWSKAISGPICPTSRTQGCRRRGRCRSARLSRSRRPGSRRRSARSTRARTMPWSRSTPL